MLAQLRDDDGHTTPYANFAVSADGEVTTLAADEIRWQMRRMWQSPDSGDVYQNLLDNRGPGLPP